MTPDPIRFPAAERTTEETVTWRALQGALVGPLSQHLTEQALVLSDLAEKVAAVDATRTRDRQEMARVQEGLRASIDATRGKLDSTEGAMAAGFTRIHDEIVATREERKVWHAEVMTAVGAVSAQVAAVASWQGKHEAKHEGVAEGKRDTAQTLAIAAAVANGKDDDPANPVADVVQAVLPEKLKKYAPWLVAAGMGLLAALQALTGCAHLSPAEERLEQVGTSAAVQCLAAPLAQCMWGAGAQGYWKCLLNAAVPCAVEHAAQAAEAGVALVYEHYGMRMAGVDPGEAAKRRGAEVLACFEGVDVPYVVEHCPDGKAPRLCLVDAATFCLDGQAELQ